MNGLIDADSALRAREKIGHRIESGLYDSSLPLALAIGKLLDLYVEQIFGNDAGDARAGGLKSRAAKRRRTQFSMNASSPKHPSS
jgi:DNA-binding XRE family transcriptional regulator